MISKLILEASQNEVNNLFFPDCIHLLKVTIETLEQDVKYVQS